MDILTNQSEINSRVNIQQRNTCRWGRVCRKLKPAICLTTMIWKEEQSKRWDSDVLSPLMCTFYWVFSKHPVEVFLTSKFVRRLGQCHFLWFLFQKLWRGYKWLYQHCPCWSLSVSIENKSVRIQSFISCTIKIFGGESRGCDTFKTASPLRTTFAFTHSLF